MSEPFPSASFRPFSALRENYPQMRFENGRRWLWNPARQQLLKIRPEERVRLQVMEWLQHNCGIPAHRISTELSVKLQLRPSEARKRADILAYSADFMPYLLIECKAEQVTLNEKAALQIAAYNEDIRAPYMMLTNGLEERCFELQNASYMRRISCGYFSEQADSNLPKVQQRLEYWQKRGFAGTPIPGFEALPQALSYLFGHESSGGRFLHVSAMAPYPDFSHYYAIQDTWALSILCDVRKNSWLVALHDPPQQQKRMFCYELSQRSNTPPLWFEPGQEFSSLLHDESVEPLLEPLRQPDEHLLRRLVARLEDLSRSRGLLN